MQNLLVPLGRFSNTRPFLMSVTRLAIVGLAGIFVVSCGHTRQATSPEPDRGPPASIIDDAQTVEVDLAELRIGVNPGDAEVIGTFDRVRVTLNSGILFRSGEATLQPGGESILSELLDVAKRDGVRLQVEGHTDDVGEEESNLELSRRRASTVSTWLSEHGVDGSRIEQLGYGQKWPRVPNDSDDNRALNRRVEIVLFGVGGTGIPRKTIADVDSSAWHWGGDWGNLVLRLKGDRFYGTYNHDAGTLVGHWQEGRLVAWWSETPSREPSKDAGECEFRFRTDGDELIMDGRWRYGTEGAWRENWDLRLIPDAPAAELIQRFDDPTAFVEHP
jgi:outer membrane protein OmpA-like peptidoglycan-associated protein